ncbi:MAG: SH3 domain-containing protein [Leptolyngbya sp. UWPOB_LEPTO1]|uniref:SH3 domain-containing protein n=1 Tax=Leptolyngbya sp. UWPOB_LEPTO1 TaxID=2815653 RepID=UPI001ACC8F45|nr:SH3 domain-containing protein [Leptolyngbya sp. UWPOB_LEPTO1]MBN8564773.1 SH3 domain-containing protein [Leptolyngbya sp. UWPOB_LEPTO1]
MKPSIWSLPILFFLVACSAPSQNTALPSASETTAPSPSASPSSLPTPVTPSPTPSIEKPSPTVPSLSAQATLTAQDPNAQINVREDASPRSTAQHYGVVGDVVQVLGEKQGDDGQTWYQVKFPSGAIGWVNGQFVAIAGKSSTERSSPAVSPSPTSEGLTPLREPVSGSCECPYDTDKRGRSCGRRSAYSRPGGAAPACYK